MRRCNKAIILNDPWSVCHQPIIVTGADVEGIYEYIRTVPINNIVSAKCTDGMSWEGTFRSGLQQTSDCSASNKEKTVYSWSRTVLMKLSQLCSWKQGNLLLKYWEWRIVTYKGCVSNQLCVSSHSCYTSTRIDQQELPKYFQVLTYFCNYVQT